MTIEKWTARDLMSRCVATLRTESLLPEAISLMDLGRYSQIPVLKGRRPVAMLTEADVRRAFVQNREDRPLGELASPLPRLIQPETRVSEVLGLLQSQESLLVVGKAGRLLGIITYWDALTLARPFLMVTEVELLLRRVVAESYEAAFGPDWWQQVPESLRQRAEEEHRQDADAEPTPEHMLGHTSFWTLIEIFRIIRPDEEEGRYQEMHRIRQLRNKVAHHYQLSQAEVLDLIKRCFEIGDYLDQLLRNVATPPPRIG